ncbi:LysE family translocator [Sneathiella glossodoripedis]|uniref:LysE family translocator n=1 Tax=Sneathiella glossodoripedis TaxID=418853 RepID=UPI00047220A5|nr:LysE family transporter [Sneathiella glossodoripedis]
MDLQLLIKGFLIGIAVAAPVGPVGALCIRRAISDGRVAAIGTGMGAAVADAIYGAVAAFGLTAVSDLLLSYQKPALIIGGIFLLYLAARSLYPSNSSREHKGGAYRFSVSAAFLSTFLLTLTNPATILSFAAIFSGIGFLAIATDGVLAATLVGGVFLGSAGWWVFLAFAAHALKVKFGDRFEAWVRIGSATIIGLFGVLALTSVWI